ncbi:hypothetical protein ACERII_06205 [Evansella sp. AB-rgal1]|uniref:hypothetical protein n=1 Tax=Evansella sp. AB-rgal1 TaxID=3242696 RepID=UPI00359D8FD0
MRGFYRLVNYEVTRMIKVTLCLCIGIILLPIYLLHLSLKDLHPHSVIERFENIYAASGAIIVFLLLLLLLIGYFVVTIYSHYWGSKSIYTYLTLPIKREAFYFSYFIAFMICLLVFFTAKLVSVYWGYSIYVSRIDDITNGEAVMTNGLFLAFIRSEFLRTIFPMTVNGIFSTVSIFLALVTGTLYGVLCERSKRFAGFFFITLSIGIIIYILNYRLSDPIYVYSNLYITGSLLFILSGYFIWKSVKILKSGSIV